MVHNFVVMSFKTYQNYTQDPLWNKIAQHSIDDPRAAFPMSSKLAAEQNWSPGFTRQAIDEYRRFIYLCCVGPHGASPPPIVDEVWHMHLTYTQDYWQRFCRDTLGRDIHHHPSSGGPDEKERHDRWYADTLILYEHTFGSPPPASIWPPPHKHTEPISLPWHYFFEPGNRSRFYLLLLPFILATICCMQPFPFLLTGPQFLVFYTSLLVSVLVCTWLSVRAKTALLMDLGGIIKEGADKYELAYLAGGRDRFMLLCISDLITQGHIIYTGKDDYAINITDTSTSDNPLFPSLLSLSDADRFTLRYLMLQVPAALAPISAPYAYLIDIYNRSFNSMVPLIATLLLGVARCIQGLVNGRPTGFLFLMVVSLFLVLISIAGRRHESFHRALRHKVMGDTVYTDHISTATDRNVIHYGIAGISGILYYNLIQRYQSLTTTYADGGGASGSGCGSGCGGGGCGGCGG